MNQFERAQNLVSTVYADGWLIACNENSDIHSRFMLNVISHARNYIFIPATGKPTVIAVQMEAPMIQKALKQVKVEAEVIAFETTNELLMLLKNLLNNKTKIAVNFGEHFFSSNGTEYADYLRVGELNALKDIAPHAKFISAAPIIYQLRSKKTPEEIKDFKESIKATEELLSRLPDWVQIGMYERDVKARLEFEYLKIGEPSFETIVGMGPNSADPHHNTAQSNTKITKGVLLVDTGLRLHRMCSDLTWTYWVGGEPKEEFMNAYQALYTAKQESYKYIKSDAPFFLPDQKCREELQRHGYDHIKLYTHGLGHSLGFEVHDIGPRMNWKIDPNLKLETNMVYSNEPGLYWFEQWGVRLEDDLVIRETGPEILSKTPKDPLTI
jgi:Xaa-Pro aminopeptidase